MTIYADALAGLFALSVALLLFYGPWQRTATDMARQLVFERRDAIFDMACDGKLSLESYEYKTIRHSLNQLIRFAHELTLPRFIFLMLSFDKEEMNRPTETKKAIEKIEDPSVRREVENHVKEARSAMIGMMAIKSPICLIFLIVVGSVALLLGGLNRIRSLFSRAESIFGEKMQAEAECA